MKLYKVFTLLICCLSIICFTSSCERDDICAEDTPTTPFLIIKFIDDVTSTDIKQPDELQVKAVDFDSVITYTTNQDSILIPLRTNALLTDFEFTINSDTEDGGDDPNTDVVSFQYTPVEEYVSSACGFRVLYNGLERTLTPEEDNGNWIKRILIEQPDVINETVAHVLIFH
ncbi:DUF6452 family protein [Aquimarina litoralis]|uniref:DUF6452 family protein n=1 Tax=Aquimarina litoralis TaxID=584605 RepID=UPI001C5979F1|nr:DUF6452 family protein [Aquimarina litoralis]MBW1296800.1 hypothetical protein [Aquimarina litoralis]